MAMKKEEHERILKEIVEQFGEPTDELLEKIQVLREDYTGEETKDGEDWENKYKEMKQKYIDRFFSGDVEEKTKEVKKETKEDVKRDGEEQTYEELFERKEG